MAGLPKKYARMGFKKGWAKFKSLRKSKRSYKVIRKKTVITMARRRYKFGKRKGYRKSKSGNMFGSVTKIVIGAGLAALYEVFVSPMIPDIEPSANHSLGRHYYHQSLSHRD